MKVLENVDLSKYTTIKIGGIAKQLLIPETIDELKCSCDVSSNYLLGGGSNLLINDERVFESVISLREFNPKIELLCDGTVYVGASVRLQKLINYINERGFGGIEYLYSVPGLVGGAIAMNAGRGKVYNQSLSDYLVSVEVLKNGNRQILRRDECDFQYRNSIFKNGDMIILSAIFSFPKQTQEESEKKKKERIELVKKVQDSSKPNFGSVFSEKNERIMCLIKKVGYGKKTHFSKKTSNWILNDHGSYRETLIIIRRVEFLHKIFGKKCEREIIIWE